jgi:sulfhydrogenase subunit delta
MPRTAAHSRPRVAVAKFASCDGCQLTLLDLEDELLEIVQRFEIADFPEATSRRSPGPYDVVFVEGAISAPEQVEQIVELRRQARFLVAIGACATAGGIQALRNWADHDAFRAAVYEHPEYIESLERATPVSDFVQVDAELRGCPIDKGQLLELLTAVLVGRRPQIRDESVCRECKRAGYVCIEVATGQACLGPVTQSGCGALCPSFGRGCYGCFGPRRNANAKGWSNALLWQGRPPEEVWRIFAGFTAFAEPFRGVVSELGKAAEAAAAAGSANAAAAGTADAAASPLAAAAPPASGQG